MMILCTESSPQTSAALQPLMQQLINQISTATSSVSSLSARSVDLDKRQFDTVIGAIVSDVIIVRPPPPSLFFLAQYTKHMLND